MDIIKNIIKMIFINITMYYVYTKIIDYKNKKIKNDLLIAVITIFTSLIYILLNKYFYSIAIMIIINIIYGIIWGKILKIDIEHSIVNVLMAFIITYITYLISIIIAGNLIMIIPNIAYDGFASLIIILIITLALLKAVFSIKRIKNGFNFLKNIKIKSKVIVIANVLCGITIIIFGLLQKVNSIMLNTCLFTGTILVFISLSYWIKSQITKTYKSKMRDRTIEIQKTEIDEKNKILEEVKEENLNFATTIHKYNKKISALEYIIKNRLEQETNTEFANELAIILKETKETAENFAKETEIKTNKIPETNVPGIDTMLKYMQEEARKKNINFDVKLNANINTLLENTISKDKFETLIGDHLKDAIIAVDTSKNTYKSILVTMGLVEGIYEFSVYDTGIEFEIETLLKLGEEQITTHEETGGSGIGFMTTFETLKECKASLIIEEYNPETTSYTKCITIRFDGKNKYKIYSYRANKIKEHKHKRKITIEELK